MFVPKNLEECFVELEKIFTEEKLKEFKNTDEDMVTVAYHFSLGMWIRNNWGLWDSSELEKYFNEMGMYHADDMSSFIITSFHRKLHNKEIDFPSSKRVIPLLKTTKPKKPKKVKKPKKPEEPGNLKKPEKPKEVKKLKKPKKPDV